MSWDDPPSPGSRGRIEPEEDYANYAEVIHRIGASLGADDALVSRARLPRLRAAAADAGDAAFVAEVDRIDGVLTARTGDHARARELLAISRRSFLALAEWEAAAQALVDAAEIDYEDGELPRAAGFCEVAAELAALEPYPALGDAANYCGLAALCYLENGDHGQAVRMYRLAIEFALQSDDPGHAAVWCHDLGNTLERMGDEAGALEQWLRCVDLDPVGDATSPAWSRLSQVYRSQGLTGPARKAADQALVTARNADTARNARYHALALTAELKPSLASLDDVRALRAEYLDDHDRRRAACCSMIEAGVLYRVGQIADAGQLWDQAASVLTDEEDWTSLAGLNAERASRLAESRDTVGARNYLTEARDLYLRANLPNDAARCDWNLVALGGPDDMQPIQARYREVRDPGTRDEAHELLGLAGFEYGLQRYDRAALLADRALVFFARHGLQQFELEARSLLASVHAQSGRHDLATQHLQAVLATTESGTYPTIRAQALTVVGGIATLKGQFGPAAVAHRSAIEILDGLDRSDTAASAFARLNLAVVVILTDPEEALRHASAASASFGRQGHVSYAARADLVAAAALTRIGAWRGAFDLAAPALLVTDILRAATASPADRDRMREIWSMIHHRVLEMLAELDDPRLTAEVLERLRANATVPTAASAPDAVDQAHPVLPVDMAAPVGDGVAITWDAPWSAGAALLAGDPELPVGLPPLVGMPWGVALEPYETIATQKLLGMPERHRQARPVATWLDQIGFA